jgi:hypothetical protein
MVAGPIAGVAQLISCFDMDGLRGGRKLHANFLFFNHVTWTEWHGAGGGPQRAEKQKRDQAKAGMEAEPQSNLIVAGNGGKQKRRVAKVPQISTKWVGES